MLPADRAGYVNDRSAAAREPEREGALLPPGTAADGTRRRILEAALRLFAAQGFHGSSMRELAKEVDLQASALYVHFPSKEHVLAELVRAGFEAHQAAIRGAVLGAGADPVSQLGAFVRTHARMHAQYPHLAIVIHTEMRVLSPELSAPALALRKESAALLFDVIQRGIALRRFSLPNVEVVASAIGAMGLRIPHWYTAASGLSIEELIEAQAELALRMVGAKSPRKRTR
jgi:AcrR family transcriptional regulator